ncbi:head GIN domain-containing protein [Lutibacter maritimus]|uniref:Putative auto-transporter adhesin, head GIN domain n=1 Tax=Lutibacter maritimus TaxID=593133 RepID=A0A1I6Q1I5_9FLAO|nr:head GIN domain-containing protein [Lutibacter maritimus]SFS46284.1 Putative auto-transporter adhesin, head GIN domain [Lutibacter maritimus]
MKNVYYLLFTLFIISCNSENASDCFQTAGKIVQHEVEVANFDKIVVNKKIALFITEGPVQKVVIESGENLLNDITAEVVANELILTNYNNCNFFRDYGITKVYVTSPNINTIRNASELDVTSIGTLTYPSLYLRSSGEKSTYLAVGDWHLTIENNAVTIWSNGISTYYLKGTSNNLDVGFSDGDTRFEGKDFIVKNITVRNVSSNDVLIYPTEKLTGSIHSTGNVISYNKPPIVDVDVQSVGKLIFK